MVHACSSHQTVSFPGRGCANRLPAFSTLAFLNPTGEEPAGLAFLEEGSHPQVSYLSLWTQMKTASQAGDYYNQVFCTNEILVLYQIGSKGGN